MFPLIHGVVSHRSQGDAEPVVISIVPDSKQVTNLSANNRNSHDFTHNYVSTTQNGTVYVIVAFVSDGSGSVTPPESLTEIVRTPATSTSDAHTYWGFYKPTQGDLNGGSLAGTFTKTSEMGQILTFEVTGAHPDTPADSTANNRSTSDRTSIGSVSLTASHDGAMLLAMLGVDTGTSGITQSMTTANSFSELHNYSSPTSGMPGFFCAVRANVAAGSYSTPVFSRSTSGRAQMEAISLRAAG